MEESKSKLSSQKDADNEESFLMNLSDEMLLAILEFLHPEELTEIALTCHRLNMFCSEDYLWERFSPFWEDNLPYRRYGYGLHQGQHRVRVNKTAKQRYLDFIRPITKNFHDQLKEGITPNWNGMGCFGSLVPCSERTMRKAIIIGSSGVGKTSFCHALRGQRRIPSRVTIGVDFLPVELPIPNGTKLTLQLWDLAGNERFGYPGVAFFRATNIVFLVFDPTNPRSLEQLEKDWYDFTLAEIGTSKDDMLMIVVATKLDLLSTRSSDSWKEVKEWAEGRVNGGCYQVSNFTLEGISEILEAIVEAEEHQQHLEQQPTHWLPSSETLMMKCINRRKGMGTIFMEYLIAGRAAAFQIGSSFLSYFY